MILPILKGAQIAEQARSFAWRRGTGYVQVFRMRGLKDFIYNQLPFWQVNADEVRIEEGNGPYAILEATVNAILDGRQEEPVNVWELAGSAAHYSLYEHPSASSISTVQIAKLRKAVNDSRSGGTPVLPDDLNAQVMYYHLEKESDSFMKGQYVLRKQQTVTSNYSLLINMNSIDCIWAIEQIYAVETISQIIVDAISQIPAPTPKTGFKFGWLKQPPTITHSANGKVMAQQEWWLRHWSEWIYTSLF